MSADDTLGEPVTVSARLAIRRPTWWSVAECRGVGLDVFYEGDPRRAIELCGLCAAREPCLAEALADPSLDHGVRGGLSANARRKRRQLEQKRQRQTEED